MTLEELEEAFKLSRERKHLLQNLNQGHNVNVSPYGGWSSCLIPEVMKALEEAEEIGNRILQIQGEASVVAINERLKELGVEI